MLSKTRLRCLWCVLTSGILLMSIRPGSIWVNQIVGAGGLNRWVHFLAFVAVLAISFAAWKGRTGVLLSLVIAAAGLALEIFQGSIPGMIANHQRVLADMFGVAGGLLFGCNVRMLRSSASERSKASPRISPSSPSPS